MLQTMASIEQKMRVAVSPTDDNKFKKIHDAKQIGHQLLTAKERQEKVFVWRIVGDKKILAPVRFELIKRSVVIGVCRETHADRPTPVTEVLHRVKPHAKQLIFLGVVFFAYRLVMIAFTEADIQALDLQQMDKEIMPIGFWWLMLKLMVLQVPLLLATWYSPLLISYHQYSVFKSIGHSVWAALNNITALITAWVSLTLAVVVVMLLLGLLIGVIAIFAKGLAAFLGLIVVMFVSLMATAFLFSIQYFSFLAMYYKKGEDFVS